MTVAKISATPWFIRALVCFPAAWRDSLTKAYARHLSWKALALRHQAVRTDGPKGQRHLDKSEILFQRARTVRAAFPSA